MISKMKHHHTFFLTIACHRQFVPCNRAGYSPYNSFAFSQARMSSDNGSQDADRSAIEIERAKSGFLYKEDVAPGLTMEMELKRILISTSSPYQKVDVVETYFGKVRSLSNVNSSRFDTVHFLLGTRPHVYVRLRLLTPFIDSGHGWQNTKHRV
jgi:hypothetical protein